MGKGAWRFLGGLLTVLLLVASIVAPASGAEGTDELGLATGAAQWWLDREAERSFPQWKGAALTSGQPYYDIEGYLVCHMFGVQKDARAVGTIVIGSSAYDNVCLEVNNGAPPSVPTAVEARASLEKDLGLVVREDAVRQPKRLLHLGIVSNYALYEVEGRSLAVHLRTKRAVLGSDLRRSIATPEQHRQYKSQTSNLLSGDEEKVLRVPHHSMADGAIPEGMRNNKNCGPTSAAMIVDYHRGGLEQEQQQGPNQHEPSHENFEGWPANHNRLYDTMGCNQTPPWPGVPPEYALPPGHPGQGWVDYSTERLYSNFSHRPVLPSYPTWVDIKASIQKEDPLLIMFGLFSPAPDWHWNAVKGYEVSGGVVYVWTNDPWDNPTERRFAWIDYYASSWLVFIDRASTTLDGELVLQGGLRPYAGHDVPLTLKIYNAATQLDYNNILTEKALFVYTKPNPDGGLEITGINQQAHTDSFRLPWAPVGTYQMTLVSPHTLVNLRKNVVMDQATPAGVNMGTLLEGNADDGVQVYGEDFSMLLNDYLQTPGGPKWNVGRCDFDRDGQVRVLDFTLLTMNYNLTSPRTIVEGARTGGVKTYGTVNLSLNTTAQNIRVGDRFYVTIDAATGSESLTGVDAFVNFDPAYLRVVSLTAGDTLPSVFRRAYNNTAGTIDLCLGNNESPVSGSFTVGTVRFEAKAATGGTDVVFNLQSQRKTDVAYEGNSLLGTTTNLTVAIQP
ncbi:MAG: cohesin domain-containing protein [Chloroflexota bacterium]